MNPCCIHDTTNVMPTTAIELEDNYRLFTGMTWTSYFAHSIGNGHQPAIVSPIRRLVNHGDQIASSFRLGAANELVATFVPSCMYLRFQNACANQMIVCFFLEV
jgi:hypothetical protein